MRSLISAWQSPVSRMKLVAGLLLLLAALLGTACHPPARLQAVLTRPLSSLAGREDRVPVRLHRAEQGLQAEPLLGKSNSIGLLVRADGLAVIERDLNGVAAGQAVWVELLP